MSNSAFSCRIQYRELFGVYRAWLKDGDVFRSAPTEISKEQKTILSGIVESRYAGVDKLERTPYQRETSLTGYRWRKAAGVSGFKPF